MAFNCPYEWCFIFLYGQKDLNIEILFSSLLLVELYSYTSFIFHDLLCKFLYHIKISTWYLQQLKYPLDIVLNYRHLLYYDIYIYWDFIDISLNSLFLLLDELHKCRCIDLILVRTEMHWKNCTMTNAQCQKTDLTSSL